MNSMIGCGCRNEKIIRRRGERHIIGSVRVSLMSALVVGILGCSDIRAGQTVSIEDIFGKWMFWADKPSGIVSMPDGERYSQIGENGKTIEVYEYATGKKTGTLMDLEKARGECTVEEILGYKVSPTEEFILFWGEETKVYRHSFKADHYIYDISHNSILKLSKDGGELEVDFAPSAYMLSYVQNNNLKIYKLKYQSSSDVTKDGEYGSVLNGIPDWVNEEEFSTTRSYEWSKDSKKIAYIRYDEREVPMQEMVMYDGSLHSGVTRFKYPKAGERNSTVSVRVFDVDSRSTKEIDLGAKECYVPRIKWTGKENQLAVVKLNRLQNRIEVLGVDAKSTVSTLMLQEKNERYFEESEFDNIHFIHEGEDFVTTSDRDGWNHIYLYGTNGVMKKQLTSGEWDVTAIYGVNEETNTLYYQAAKNSPMRREIYAIDLKTYKERVLAGEAGTNDATFSEGCKYYVCDYSNVGTPNKITFCDAKGKTLRTYGDNSLEKVMAGRKFSKKEFTTFTTSDGTKLNAWMVKPLNFDSGKKYPVLIVQYSGPNSQEVLDKWDIDWEQTLASEGVIVACVDPRGTGCRGADFRKCTYRKLGEIESNDMIDAAKEIGKLPYVDPSRIGIWGWSYGGFMSCLCLCRTDVFRLGISVAPVVNWKFYDTVYTERYMQTPELNPGGYELCPLSKAKDLEGRLLLVHGTADDNVHIQNQMEMVNALIEADKDFEMFAYPNKNHSIIGGTVRVHLYSKMIKFIKREFGL